MQLISLFFTFLTFMFVKFSESKKVNNIYAANSTFVAIKRFKFESQNFLDPGLSKP